MQTIRLRRGPATEWAAANPILRLQELGVEADTGKTKTGDGVTPWASLPYDPDPPGPGVDPGDGIPAWRGLAVAPPVAGSVPPDGSIGTAKLADGAVTPAKLDHAAPSPRYRSGFYYGPQTGRTVNGNGADNLTAVPFWVGESWTFDRIACAVTTAAAGSTVRLGIYADNGQGLPGALVLDAGTVSGEAVAAVEATISQSLAPGWYWLAAVNQGGNPALRGCSSFATMPVGSATAAESTQSQPVTGHLMGGVTGALPATFTRSASALAPALVVLRAA